MPIRSSYRRAAGLTALASLAAYGLARLVADTARRAPARMPLPPQRMVDDVASPHGTAPTTSADDAYYEWRAEVAAHADERQQPVDE